MPTIPISHNDEAGTLATSDPGFSATVVGSPAGGVALCAITHGSTNDERPPCSWNAVHVERPSRLTRVWRTRACR